MAQPLVFIWMAVVENGTVPQPGRAGFLVRPAYRAAPIGTPVPIIERSTRRELGTATFVAIHVAPPEDLRMLYADEMDAATLTALDGVQDDFATLLRYVAS